MEKIMGQVKTLYETLSDRLSEVKILKAELDARENNIRVQEDVLADKSKTLAKKEKEYKGLESAVAEKINAQEMKAEINKMKDELAEDRAKTKEIVAKAEQKMEEAYQMDRDILAERDRFAETVKKFNERKKKVKEEVMKELGIGK